MQKYQSYQNKAYSNSVKKKQLGLLESFYEQGMDDFFDNAGFYFKFGFMFAWKQYHQLVHMI